MTRESVHIIIGIDFWGLDKIPLPARARRLTHLVGAVAVADVAGEGERELSVQHDMADLTPVAIIALLYVQNVEGIN